MFGTQYSVFVDGADTGGSYCDRELPAAAAPPQVTPAMVQRAFESYSWPASELQVQPPNGRTAVNFETFFYTEDDEPVTHAFTLLGRQVEVEATPASYTWVWGDGEQATTAGPGAPYPAGDVTHEYLRKGAVQVRLDTTYAGRYRVDGGPWTGLLGTLTVPGTPQGLQVVEVQPTLVS
ncbi:hypothetical protein [Nocardioides litoris]|uniref:hypothetical protein n=1 Tax=Nocardioides litoris TaxID=1926648 RepID=UPI0011216D3C|nr:hypothetical protein [Nocardioides litoris]